VLTVATAHLVGSRDDLRDRDTGERFDAATYSRMKHGDLAAAHVLGGRLASAVVAQVPALVTDPAPLVLPVAYLAVPPACLVLAHAVLRVLSAQRVARGLEPGRVIRVAKGSVTHTDYATASEAERRAELAAITFRLDDDVAGAQVLVVDDVRVTGLAEARIVEVLAAAGPRRLVAAYVAVVQGELASDPSVEAVLNTAAVRSVADLRDAVREGRFTLTIRFLKRLLQADPDERRAFLDACPPALIAEICGGASATGPEFCAAHRAGLDDARARLERVPT
jgi:hypothetical protein